MGLKFEYAEGATPIDPEEAEALIPKLATQEELNDFEFLNIAKAAAWAERDRKVKQDLLSPATLKLLHYRMFNNTWRWAGRFRTTQKSIGVEAYRITSELLSLTEDVKCWLEFNSYSHVEIAARFHHRLVLIHPFPNGNGRHARLATDLLSRNQGWSLPSWGADSGLDPKETRSRYIRCLQAADLKDIGPLIEFLAVT